MPTTDLQAKPFLPVDIIGNYDHDVEPSARTLESTSLTYDMISVQGICSIRDWWDLLGSAANYSFSDSNTREHYSLCSSWLVWEQIGGRVGLRYAYTTAEEDRDDYWTPYQLSRYQCELSVRNTYMRTYYNLGARFGYGQEGIRPEEDQKYLETVERAQREHWDPGLPPSANWKPIYGFSASVRTKVWEHWELNGEVSYNALPDYKETTIEGGAKYKF